MPRTFTALCTIAACLAIGTSALAQENTSQAPPKVLKILRETIKPGQDAAHGANESAWIRALKAAHYDVPTLAMTSLTGDSQVWFLVGFPSWAAYQNYLEKTGRDVAVGRIVSTYGPRERDSVSNTETVTCRYHAEYSYEPNVNIGEYKYIAVGILRFRVGADIANYFKTLEAARAKANLDNHTIVYEVNSGAHGGTYLVFTPMSGISRWDSPQNPDFLAALRASNWRQIAGDSIVDTEQRLFQFSPEMSLPTKEIVAANPGFWNGKPAKQKKAATTTTKK